MNLPNITLIGQQIAGAIKKAAIDYDRDNETFASGKCTNVDVPAEDLGTTIDVYDRKAGGYSQFTYLKYAQGGAAAIAYAGVVCGVVKGKDYEVTADGGNVGKGSYVAVSLAQIDDGKYGWFWTGGVCPFGFVPGLESKTIVLASAAVQGEGLELELTDNALALDNAGTAGMPVVGYAKVAGT